MVAFGTSPALAGAAALAGFCVCLVALALRLAESHGVRPVQVGCISALAGLGVFGFKSAEVNWTEAPSWLWAVAALSGLTQYGAVWLIKPLLARGPLSPVWCAMSLSFVPAALYARIVHGIELVPLQYLGLAVGIASILLGAVQQQHANGAREGLKKGTVPFSVPSPFSHPVIYLLLLLALFACNSFVTVAMSDLMARTSNGQPLMRAYGDAFFMVLYLSLGMAVWLHLARDWRTIRPRPFLALGAMAAAGSVAGMWLLSLCSGQSPAVTFTVMSVVSLLGAAMVSVLYFSERAGWAWYGMMGMGILSVVLVQGNAVLL